MPEEVFGNRTKHSLDNALRELLTHKPLDQIRVRELTDRCAIRRQSFYYHFPDVPALFDWSLQQERARLCLRQENCLTWQQALLDLLAYTAGQRGYYLALLDSRGRTGLREVMGDAVRAAAGKDTGLLPPALRRTEGPGGGAAAAGLLGDDPAGPAGGLALRRSGPFAGRGGGSHGKHGAAGADRRGLAERPAMGGAGLKKMASGTPGKDRDIPVLAFCVLPTTAFVLGQFRQICPKFDVLTTNDRF